ncbi:Uncharacterised protein [Klebsiella pneumoniae]|nr:Uncharacterised protein [Klebsiella pneumoniae]
MILLMDSLIAGKKWIDDIYLLSFIVKTTNVAHPSSNAKNQMTMIGSLCQMDTNWIKQALR